MTTPAISPVPGPKPLVILHSSGVHLYREYLLRSIARHARVWLLAEHQPTWESPYIVGNTVVDFLDTAQVVAAGHAVASAESVSGVIGWDEIQMVTTAELANSLGVSSASVDAVHRCRDKHETRRALNAAGVGQPKSGVAVTLAEAEALATSFGYPVVAKPRRFGSSIGVSRADSPEQLRAAFEGALYAIGEGVPDRGVGVLIEECVAGFEVSVDSAIVDGVLRPLFVARKRLGFEPYCEEVGHSVDAGDPLLTDAGLVDLLQRAHQAVGYHNGITHTEVMITADGPKVIEINARLGGDLIPYVASVAMGLDIGAVMTDVAFGRQPVLPSQGSAVAHVDFFYPDSDLQVEDLIVADGELPAGVVRLAPLARAGQVLKLPPAGHVVSRYGYVVTRGTSHAECKQSADRARSLITLLTGDPVGAASDAS